MRDVFYSGVRPGVFAHEQWARNPDHARELARTDSFWWITYLTDYTAWDFLWQPPHHQQDQRHVWGTQHQAQGGCELIPRQGWQHTQYHTQALPRWGSVPRIGLDWGSGVTVDCEHVTRVIGSYLGTLQRVLRDVEHEHVWIVSSECDYAEFDWTWHPSEWQQDHVHVFAADNQQFGDTFYINVPEFRRRSLGLPLLEHYPALTFHKRSVPRLPLLVVEHDQDSHVEPVRTHEFARPLTVFSTVPVTQPLPAVNLWRPETRVVTPLQAGASTVIVPRDAQGHVRQQLYDYAGLDRTWADQPEPPLDVVFIENGEATAEFCWQQLLLSLRGHANHLHRISGVNGRDQAYRAAAEISGTAWFFAVFAKLEMDTEFDWSWQPDRMQQAKHYIFYARNPINGLEYGHQAMIAYNKRLVLSNNGTGLDFTLNDPHAVVPQVTGTAHYAATPWMAWRTAFRESIKLRHSLPDVENEYRLQKWLENDITPGKWSQRGAQDAMEYYDQVQGDFAELRKSYEWAWLSSYFFFKYNQSTDQ